MCTMSEPPAEKRCRSIEEDVRVFKKYWTEKFGVINKDKRSLIYFLFLNIFNPGQGDGHDILVMEIYPD